MKAASTVAIILVTISMTVISMKIYINQEFTMDKSIAYPVSSWQRI